ncbi:MAG: OmpA family protein [Propionivibrio sp.]|uniref:OmpA family protein n=1 Tax=Propionivibrio sp. TaxID=2212460 RepID=UPI001A4D1EBF|nr:OmpA family protein [Propionivibrio sp.]MBL8415817.1 OmpA family protein [Propionivibrio sp.]
MNKTVKHSMMAVLAATLGLSASLAQAQTYDSVYVIDSRGVVALSGTGLCWRTGFWTPAGAAKDPNGCKCDKDLIPKEICEPPVAAAAAPTPKPMGEKITVAADALFDFNKSVLRPEGKAKIDEVVAKSGKLNLEVVIVVGHTDRIGGKEFNQRLSERRAAAVKDYMVSKGIPANRVYTEGKGLTQPVTKPDQCPNKLGRAKLIACLQPDRRADIEMIGTSK